MADSKDKQISTDKQQKKSSSVFYIILIILLTVTAGAGGFYLWQQQQHDLKKQTAINARLTQQFQALNSTVKTLSNQLTNSQKLIEALQTQQTDVSSIAQKAIAISNRSQKGWVLAEIDYLLRMANRRLQIGKDINTAIAAMDAADKRIHDLKDLSLFPVRKQLKKDIANLKALHQVDVNGTAMAIDQILEHLSSLPFKTINDEIKARLDKPTDNITKNEDAGFIDSVIDTVMNIGDIKVHHRSLEPVTNAAQQHQLEQRLRNHLLAARLSILRYDQTQFMHDLKQSQDILQQYYNLNDNRVAQVKNDIKKFSQLNLSPELPNINLSWTMLQQVMAGKKPESKKIKNAKTPKPVIPSAKKLPIKKSATTTPIKVEAL